MICTEGLRRILPRLVVLVALLCASTASAQADDKMQRARDHFDRGTSFFKQRQYDKALEELMQAYVLDPNPALVYNIARVHEEADDLDNALRFFQNYLKIAPRAKNRRQVKRRIRALKKAIKRRPKRGFLSVRSTPSGAVVRVNGVMVGQSPVSGVAVKTGMAQVVVEKDGFRRYEQSIRIRGGASESIQATLQDRPSAILINTVPTGAKATLLGATPKPLGACPCLTELSSGAHQLRVEAPGHAPKVVTFEKRPGETLKLNVTLQPAQSASTLLVEANVAGADVIVAGAVVGRTPLPAPLQVPVGIVDVEVRAPGFVSWRSRVQTTTGQLTRVSAFLQAGGAPGRRPVVVSSADDSSDAVRSAGWGMLTIGLVGLAAGGTLTVLSQLDANTADPNNGTYFEVGAATGNPYLVRQDITRQKALELEERAKNFELGSIISYSVGGAALITGIVLLAVSPEPDDSDVALPELDVTPLRGGGLVRLNLSWQ